MDGFITDAKKRERDNKNSTETMGEYTNLKMERSHLFKTTSRPTRVEDEFFFRSVTQYEKLTGRGGGGG